MRFTAEELYPVYAPDERWGEVEVPEPLASEQARVLAALHANNGLIIEYVEALRRDETAYREVSEPLQRRLERGRKRPHRRPRP